jgi:hypothetical protein
LCEDYCHDIFSTCKDIPFSIGRYISEAFDVVDDKKYGAFYLNDPKSMTAEDFCENLIAPEPNCFRGKKPTGTDDNCKCPDHKCHKSKQAKDKTVESKKEL